MSAHKVMNMSEKDEEKDTDERDKKKSVNEIDEYG